LRVRFANVDDRHFRPELEARIKDFSSKHGGMEARAGGWMPDTAQKGQLIAPGQ
jgi:NADH dehydrogenase (ubiquinone) flavoprotein 1